MTPGWKVDRHGGRRNDNWRTVFEGDEESARSRFKTIYLEMRQGGLRLLDITGLVRNEYQAPLLRTRW